MHRYFYALAAVLMASPAWASVDAAAFRGALTQEVPVRLLRAAVYLQPGGEAPDLSESPLEPLTRDQLQAEYGRLDKTRPSLGAPIALTATGGGLIIAAVVVLYIDFVLYLTTEFGTASLAVAGYIFLICAAALAVSGGVLLAVGLVKLFQRLGQRRAGQQRMDDINTRLETLDRAAPPPEPHELPPAPPDTGASLFDVHPTLVVATF